MAQVVGSLSQIIYDQETTFKTDPGTPNANILPFISEDLRLARDLFSSEAITAARDVKRPGRGNYNIAGKIELEINPKMGTIFKHSLGSATSTIIGAGPAYNHVIKVGSLPVGLVIEKQMRDKQTSPTFERFFKYNGCRINALNIGIDPSGIIKGSIDIMGAKETVGTVSLDSTPNDLGHVPFDAFEIATADILEGGAAIANVTHFDFAIANNLDGDVFVIGGAGERQAIPEGKVKVSGKITAMFDSITLYNKAVNHTESSLKVIFKRGTGDGTANNEYLELFVPELVYMPNAPVIAGPKGILVDLPFEAYYDNSAEASSMQVTFKTTQTSI